MGPFYLFPKKFREALRVLRRIVKAGNQRYPDQYVLMPCGNFLQIFYHMPVGYAGPLFMYFIVIMLDVHDPLIHQIDQLFHPGMASVALDRPVYARLTELLQQQMEPVRQAVIGPMLVERTLQAVGYEEVSLDDPRLRHANAEGAYRPRRHAAIAGRCFLLIDDVCTTGGTMAAAYELVKRMNPKKIYINFIIELGMLNGRANLPADAEVTSLIKY